MLRKIISITTICLLLVLSILFVACDEKSQYQCNTCCDEGVIDCPNCHVARCNYKGQSTSGKLTYCDNGNLMFECSNCDGKSIIGTQRCSSCSGKGYFGTIKCPKCNGKGRTNVICQLCDNGYVHLSYCSHCVGGYIGGTKCSTGCTLPYSNKTNNGYTYIDCPDCEK